MMRSRLPSSEYDVDTFRLHKLSMSATVRRVSATEYRASVYRRNAACSQLEKCHGHPGSTRFVVKPEKGQLCIFDYF